MKPIGGAHPPIDEIILALRRLNSAFSASNRVVGTHLGIKDSDLAVLDELNQEGAQTPTELANRTRTHLATMTGILSRLERDGWIERRPDEADRRSVRIHATGVSQLTDMYARVNEELAGVVEQLPDDQREVITSFLTGTAEIVTAFAPKFVQQPHSQESQA